MPDNRISQLLPASFRGVSFSVSSEVLPEEGRKIVLHEYVNSSERFVEDLGQLPGKFTVQAFVHGADWRARADALRAALNTSGPGELVLPVFGAQNVYALPYSVDSSHREVGEIRFTLEFAAGRPAAGPDTARRDIEEVYDLGDLARAAIGVVFGDDWRTPGTVANSAVAQYDLIRAAQAVPGAFATMLPTSTLERINGTVSLVSSTAPTLIRNGAGAASNLISIWQQTSLGFSGIIAAAGNISGAFDGLIGMTRFGGGLSTSLRKISNSPGGEISQSVTVPLWPETTAQRIQRNDNRETIVYSNRVASLVSAYEVAAAQDYRTLDEINDVRAQLESANEQLMRIDTIDADIIQSDDRVRDAVLNLRIAALDVLEQKRQEAFETVTVNRETPASAFVEAHRLYAEEFTSASALQSRAIELRRLNPAQKSTALVGDITAFRGN
jgi:prophage DNA circulation protein